MHFMPLLIPQTAQPGLPLGLTARAEERVASKGREALHCRL